MTMLHINGKEYQLSQTISEVYDLVQLTRVQKNKLIRIFCDYCATPLWGMGNIDYSELPISIETIQLLETASIVFGQKPIQFQDDVEITMDEIKEAVDHLKTIGIEIPFCTDYQSHQALSMFDMVINSSLDMAYENLIRELDSTYTLILG